jgi:hypothetical protein
MSALTSVHDVERIARKHLTELFKTAEVLGAGSVDHLEGKELEKALETIETEMKKMRQNFKVATAAYLLIDELKSQALQPDLFTESVLEPVRRLQDIADESGTTMTISAGDKSATIAPRKKPAAEQTNGGGQ